MLWIKSFHIIAVVSWFAALFYLPRLYVYHAETTDLLSINRFKIMERRLYYGIMWPAGILTTVFGLAMLYIGWGFYLKAHWMHAKLLLVVLLWLYHIYCGSLRNDFLSNKNIRSSTFYRVINEIPTLFLVAIIILVVVKPF